MRPKFPTGPLRPIKRHIKRKRCTAKQSQRSLTHEEKFSSVEEAREAALEVAQEEDEKAQESSEAEEEVGTPLRPSNSRGYGVVWYPNGLQLWG